MRTERDLGTDPDRADPFERARIEEAVDLPAARLRRNRISGARGRLDDQVGERRELAQDGKAGGVGATFSKTCLRWVATVYVDRKRRSPA